MYDGCKCNAMQQQLEKIYNTIQYRTLSYGIAKGVGGQLCKYVYKIKTKLYQLHIIHGYDDDSNHIVWKLSPEMTRDQLPSSSLLLYIQAGALTQVK